VSVAEQTWQIRPEAQLGDRPPHPEFFFADCFRASDSATEVDDAVGWALATDPETLVLTSRILGGVAS
jgi:hypothetical protein